jgi:hypothetical protein
VLASVAAVSVKLSKKHKTGNTSHYKCGASEVPHCQKLSHNKSPTPCQANGPRTTHKTYSAFPINPLAMPTLQSGGRLQPTDANAVQRARDRKWRFADARRDRACMDIAVVDLPTLLAVVLTIGGG